MAKDGDGNEFGGMPDLAGRRIGDFEILRRIGNGAMAEVYQAEQLSLKRQVALKILRPELARDPTYVQRFRREAQAVARLVHPNIVQIFEVGNRDDLHYIAVEYVPGLNLRQWLQKNGPPDLRTALIVMRQAAAALAKAGEHGIIHRDIKPENILITHALEVKVADFGLARLRNTEEGVELTRVGMTMGTPLYMSPEQIEGRPLDARSDIYSLGVTCYQMLAGEPPFRGDSPLAVAVQHLKKNPEPLENHRPDLPPALCRIVHQMMAKQPEHRFADSRLLLSQLRRIYAEHVAEDWPSSLPELETAEYSTVTSTRALAELHETMHQTRRRRRKFLLLWMPIWMAAVAGGLVAGYYRTQEPPLLAKVPTTSLAVPRQETVLGQLLYANQVGTEKAWRAVIEYFPEKSFWTSQAKMRLGQIYLREDRLDDALAVFDDLAASDDSEIEQKAFGLAGRVGVLTLKNRYRDASETLNLLWPIRDHVRDPLMQRMLDYSIRTIRERLGPMGVEQWSEWLQSLKEADEQAVPN